MATTHVFIVDDNTFKYHLQYMFVGTGAKDKGIDFNGTKETKYHHSAENGLVGMVADLNRLRKGDNVIFYLLQTKKHEGKFFGIFKVAESPFIDNNGQFLGEELEKKLTFRAIIEPKEVYPQGVSEWEALDEIRGMTSPNQMLWSLIYRKLKGNRGNTMITIYEAERLFHLIRLKNNNTPLSFNSGISFDGITLIASYNYPYTGNKNRIDIFPRLATKFKTNKAFESHLQAEIVQKIDTNNQLRQILIGNNEVDWIGNEISCGVGMQRIDIMISLIDKKLGKKFILPIELKAVPFYQGITRQLQRYIDWLNQYYIPNRYSTIQPVIITKENTTMLYETIKEELKKFNKSNSDCLPVKWISFTLNEQLKDLLFKEETYI